LEEITRGLESESNRLSNLLSLMPTAGFGAEEPFNLPPDLKRKPIKLK
jgi:hypothetical protein